MRMVAATVLVLLVPLDALAQVAEPSVRGSVTGTLARGRDVTIRVTATHPEGFQALAAVSVNLELHGVTLEDLDYDITQQTLRVGGGTVLAGTGNTATGQFFEVRGLGLRTTTAGNELTLSFRARLIQEVPPEARFRFTTEDDAGREASTALRAAVEEDGDGISLGTVVLAILGALVAGGFIGGQLTASRRPRRSVYATVARKIDRERAGTAAGEDRS